MNKKTISGKYEIIKEIGRGGMGVIYEALHTTLNRTVAIKVLHSHFTGDPAFLARFEREARAMARLDHANIIRVFDVGEDDGVHYIVMEYFPGKDLKQIILDRGIVSQKETLSIALQVTKGLSYAHEHGIVHRDIKPGNIMLNEAHLVKIADFGIASATDEASVTATGHVIGTPEYMSVEQARGEQLDGRSDLYSLGMVTYELLTGNTSFSGISKIAILGKLVYEKKDFELIFQDHILPSVRNIVSGLLKKNKDDRTSDTATLVKLLMETLSELETEMSQSETLDRTFQSITPLINKEEKPPGIKEEEGSLETVMYQKTRPDHPSPAPPSLIESDQKSPKILDVSSSQPPERPLPKSASSRPYVSRVITLVVLLVLVFAGFGYYLSVRDEGSPKTTATKTPRGLDALRPIQKSIRESQTLLSQSHQEADQAKAPRWAKDIYGKAFDLENRGEKILDEANTSIKQDDFQVAKEKLQKALTLFTQAKDGFIRSKSVSEKNITLANELKSERDKEQVKAKEARKEMEQIKQKRLKVQDEIRKQNALAQAEEKKLKQAKIKAEQVKRERKRAETEQVKRERKRAETEQVKRERKRAEAELRRLNQERARAKNRALAKQKGTAPSSSMSDMNILGVSLNKLKAAYQNKEISQLQTLSQMSSRRLKFLKQIFDNYKTIQVAVTDLKVVGNEATATISIKELIALDGNRVLPSKRWKDADLKFKKVKGQWGKGKW